MLSAYIYESELRSLTAGSRGRHRSVPADCRAGGGRWLVRSAAARGSCHAGSSGWLVDHAGGGAAQDRSEMNDVPAAPP